MIYNVNLGDSVTNFKWVEFRCTENNMFHLKSDISDGLYIVINRRGSIEYHDPFEDPPVSHKKKITRVWVGFVRKKPLSEYII